MAFYRGNIPPLVGGVSQQESHARLPNQVTEQVNMLSDLVTGPRRRPGFQALQELPGIPGDCVTHLVAIGEVPHLATVDAATGDLKVFEVGSPTPVLESTQAYLQGAREDIRITQHGNDLFFLNRGVPVQSVADPASGDVNRHELSRGFFYIQQGAFDTEYAVTISGPGSGGDPVTMQAKYTTPASDYTKATPEYIAEKLKEEINGWDVEFTAYVVGPYVALNCQDPYRELKVDSTLAEHMVVVSGGGVIKDASLLPARNSAIMHGYIIRVGHGLASMYYRWDGSERAWTESPRLGTKNKLVQLPIYLDVESMQVKRLEDTPNTGRQAGDEENAPDPYFVGKRLTGIGTFQGRFMYLCGEYVTLSTSNSPAELYRSTMTELRDDDPIEIASTTTYGVSFEYAVPHNGDLLLTSEGVQGIIPGRTVLTPKNAVISIAAQYKMQVGLQPVSTGKSLLYAANSSVGTSSVWELTPSEYTDQQVTAHNITEHLPSYMQGRIRRLSTSQTNGMALLLDEEPGIVVHEYLWEGVQKIHTAFHRWELEHPVVDAHMYTNTMYVITAPPGKPLRVLRWDSTHGRGDEWVDTPKLDNYAVCNTQAGVVRIPKWIYSIDELRSGDVLAYGKSVHGTPYPFRITEWVLAGDEHVGTSQYLTGSSVVIGKPFSSTLVPTTPTVRDQMGAPVLTERSVLHSFTAHVRNTGTFEVHIKDRARTLPVATYTPLSMYSNDLDAGVPLASSDTRMFPARTDLSSTEVRFTSRDVYDMNITALEYGYRHKQRGRRAYNNPEG